MGKSEYDPVEADRRAWNSRRKVGAKRALKPRQVWAIRFFLDQYRRTRDRALFDLAIDSKLRGCDVVKVKIGDIVLGGQIRARAIVVQAKTGKPVQFELMFDARTSLLAWLERRGGTLADYVFPSRIDHADHLRYSAICSAQDGVNFALAGDESGKGFAVGLGFTHRVAPLWRADTCSDRW